MDIQWVQNKQKREHRGDALNLRVADQLECLEIDAG